jgi:hypothetical protein
MLQEVQHGTLRPEFPGDIIKQLNELEEEDYIRTFISISYLCGSDECRVC